MFKKKNEIPVRVVPAEWTCLPDFYGTDDGCDCGCSVWDPDCDEQEEGDFGMYTIGETCESLGCSRVGNFCTNPSVFCGAGGTCQTSGK